MIKLRKHFFIQYGLHVILLFFFVNLTIAYIFHFSVIATGCMTAAQVQSDNRCLYVWNNQIYQKGDKNNPHQSHPCGSDITAVIPATHLGGGMASHLLPNYIANVCAAVATPTPKPSPKPSPTPTPKPSPTPTSKPTPTPSSKPASPTPTSAQPATPSPTKSVTILSPTPTTGITPTTIAIAITSPAPSPSSLPTDSPTETPQPTANGPTIHLSLYLPGISDGGNLSPIHANRNVLLYAFNVKDNLNTAQPLYTASDVVTFDNNAASPNYKLFTNPNFNISSIPPGDYQFAVQVPQYLKQQIVDTQSKTTTFSVSNSQAPTLPITTIIPGDINPASIGDTIINANDYNVLINCYGQKSTTSSCLDPHTADLNDDGNIDGIDYNLFLIGLRQYLILTNSLPSVTPTPVFPIDTPSATPTATATPIPSSQPTSVSPTANTVTLSPTNTPAPSQTLTAATPTPSQAPSIIRTLISPITNNSALLTKVFDVFIFIIFCITLFVGVLRSKLFKKSKPKLAAAPVQNAPTPPEKITPLPVSLADGQTIDKTFFVKPYKSDPNWVVLVDEDEKIFGYANGKQIPEGFAQIKGTVKKSADSLYIEITNSGPAV